MKPSHLISRSTSRQYKSRLHLNAFRGVRAISKFDLISLSPPPSAHPEAFQRLLVRPSRWCYPSFSLAKGRSLGFASAPSDCTPYSDSLSLRLQVSRPLTLPEKATRRFIMQKARRHAYALRPLVGTWFQVLFHSSIRSAFHLSFTVLVHYRSLGSI